jgi:hypothetical protein
MYFFSFIYLEKLGEQSILIITQNSNIKATRSSFNSMVVQGFLLCYLIIKLPANYGLQSEKV